MTYLFIKNHIYLNYYCYLFSEGLKNKTNSLKLFFQNVFTLEKKRQDMCSSK